MNAYRFNSFERANYSEIEKTLSILYKTDKPVVVCVGTDLVVGDSFGPLVGSLIKNRLEGKAFVYGTLDSPITAKEVETVYNMIGLLHPNSKVLVVDAAVGNANDVGTVKIRPEGIKPGLGFNKDLPVLGNVSVIGVVADKNASFTVRLGLVYALAKDVSEGIIKALM